jgi:hypothetical protein
LNIKANYADDKQITDGQEDKVSVTICLEETSSLNIFKPSSSTRLISLSHDIEVNLQKGASFLQIHTCIIVTHRYE